MYDIDEKIRYDICMTQGRIYEYAANESYYMPLFSDQYLQSDFCRRAMDAKYSRFQLADEEECMDFILPEIGNRLQKMLEDEIFDPDVAYWIGFTYRQMALLTDLSSTELASRISFATMCRYYAGLHTIDEDMAFDIINHDFALQVTV